MDSIAFVVLFALLFSIVVFRKKIKVYATFDMKKLHHNTTHGNIDTSFSAITNFTDIENCLKSFEDCDVTYKARSSRTASFVKKVEYTLASNDEKNSPKYNPTSLQDIYPTDPA